LKRALAASIALALAVAACGSDGPATARSVTLVTHDSFNATDAVLAQFTTQTGVALDVPKGTGDAGSVLAKAILAKGKPEGDVIWGIDNTMLSRAVEAGILVPYQSPALAALDPAAAALVPGHELTPVDTGDVCVNVDTAYYQGDRGPAPTTLDDLVAPRYKDQLVVQNPATSSPGLAFLLATVARYGPEGWEDYWRKLRANGVKVVDGWTEAYSTEFSGSSGKGSRPLVVSYASSPVAEIVFAADPKPATPPTASFADGCFRQVEFVGILKGTKHEAQARQLVDFLVSKAFQEDMPLNMFVSPVLQGAALPDLYRRFTAVPAAPLSLDPAVIAKNRDAWVERWTSIVLR
jgi:thiamine transport system substrate-binding protein